MPHLCTRHIIAIAALMLLVIVTGPLHAATAAADSLARPQRPWTGMAVGAGMLATSAIARQAYPDVPADIAAGKNTDRGTDWLQYAPLAAPWILKATGVPTRSGWGRMAVSQGIATMLMAGSVKTLKETVSSTRPDGSDTHSFPSGHTAWAFMGATMMARELADVSPWYAVGAYAVATGIAVERAVDRHHYPTDIVAGAGIGILSAQLGYWLGDIIFGDRNLDIRAEGLRLNTNVSYLSLQTGLALPLGPVKAGDTRLQRLPALSAALRGGWAISDHWGLALELGLLSTPLITDVHHDRTYVKSLSSLSAVIAPYYQCPLNDRVSFTAEVAAGYRHNLPLNLDDSSIETGTSSPVGRINIGCVLRFSSNFSARASIGYEMSRYRFIVRPSAAYSIPAPATARGIASALLVNISSRYEF
ncbi:phosphatase PAP2 family protein [Muribaculaceae bacterium Isolate-110 (HZI)]|nr:phosphatase PAP2 family protein [Muribaculaceae bacterium Isolate-110 (HZI)]